MERFFGGSDIEPSYQTLQDNYVYFNFAYHGTKMLMIALAYIIVQE